MLHIGDLSYAVGYSSEWEEWLSQIEPYAAHAPVMVQMGNHERNWVNGRREIDGSGHYTWGTLNSTSSGGECGIPTAKRFSMPGNWHERWATREPGVWGAVDRTTRTLNDAVWCGART